MVILGIGLDLLNSIALMFLITFLLSRTTAFSDLILNEQQVFWKKVMLTLTFGMFGIFGTYYGFPIDGAIANSRAIAVIVAGMLGGPFAGLGSGLIAGFHRWSIDIGGFTSFACMLSTIVEGGLGSLCYRYKHQVKHKWLLGFWITVLAEAIQMVIIILVAKPQWAAINLVKKIGAPMILMNSLGVALFIVLLESIFKEKEREAALQSELALKIAEKTLPILRNGIDRETALAACKIIYSFVKADAVAITRGNEILAHVGVGADHHLPGEMVKTAATKQVLESKSPIIVGRKVEVGCLEESCQLQSAVIVPLFKKEQVIGVLKLYKTKENGITTIDVRLAEGLAKLFSTQIELAEIDRNAKLLSKAELRALQAQINPHFLFNALNVVVSMCRINPETARKLLVNLGNFLRESFREKDDIVDIMNEIKHIEAYLEIEKARFGEKLTVYYQIDRDCFQVPQLILQPLVENAVKHGIYPKKEGGCIWITVGEGESNFMINIEDNGVGFDAFGDQVTNNGIGIKNVDQRLRSIYGDEYGLHIESERNQGTKVLVKIPKRGV